jgi:hypothetical protein
MPWWLSKNTPNTLTMMRQQVRSLASASLDVLPEPYHAPTLRRLRGFARPTHRLQHPLTMMVASAPPCLSRGYVRREELGAEQHARGRVVCHEHVGPARGGRQLQAQATAARVAGAQWHRLPAASSHGDRHTLLEQRRPLRLVSCSVARARPGEVREGLGLGLGVEGVEGVEGGQGVEVREGTALRALRVVRALS